MPSLPPIPADDATLRYICRLAMRLPFLLAAACCAGAALAQALPPGLPGLAPAKQAATPAAAPSPAPDASAAKRVADARAELERIAQQAATREGVPAGVPNDALIERRASAERLVRAHEQALDNERVLAETQARRTELAAKAAAWSGFPTPPPYSLLLVVAARAGRARGSLRGAFA
jgi:hypothetical protein